MQDNKMVDLVIDKSGSMNKSVRDPNGRGAILSKIEVVKNIFVKELEKQLSTKDHVGIRAFDTSSKKVHPIVSFNEKNRRKMKKNVDRITTGGDTALYDALGSSVDDLVEETKGEDMELKVLCMTDGKENSSRRFNTEDEVIDYANSKDVDLEIIIIGIGDMVDDVVLGKIAKGTGGQYIPASATQKGMGKAAKKAGDLIGGKSKGSGSRSSRSGASSNGSRNDRLDSNYEEKRSRIRFEGNITRSDIEYMEKIAGRAVDMINDDYEMIAGSVSVPVYMLEEDKFERIFGRKTTPSKYCQRLYNRVFKKDLPARDICEGQVDENGLPTAASVGAGGGRHGGSCSGELMACFVNDMIFHRFKDKMEDAGIPEVTPGIYIKDVRERGRNGSANIKCAMSYLAVTSTVYYSTSRISAVKRGGLSDIDSLTYGTISLLCNNDKTLDEFRSYSELVGTWALPLQLIKKTDEKFEREILSKLHEKMPVHYLLNGDITEKNEESYIEEAESILDELSREYL